MTTNRSWAVVVAGVLAAACGESVSDGSGDAGSGAGGAGGAATGGSGGEATGGAGGVATGGAGGEATGGAGGAGGVATGGSGGASCGFVVCDGLCCGAGESCGPDGACALPEGAQPGYTLYSVMGSSEARLIDEAGTVVKRWTTARGGYATYLTERGTILRPADAAGRQLNGGAAAGRLQEFAWDGSIVWDWTWSSATYVTHHDVEPMPNGNVLVISWEVKSVAESAAVGRTAGTVTWPDAILEVRPTGATTGEIVWEWHAWDHLVQDSDAGKPNYGVIAEHPERLDANLSGGTTGPGPGGRGGDWLHVNSVGYDPTRDLVVMSSHTMDEVWVIDHSTTTEQARGSSGGNFGKGGDLLWRWGNPGNYGTAGEHVLDVVHSAEFIPEGLPGAGNLVLFNNREAARASHVYELALPIEGFTFARAAGAAFGPAAPLWSYEDGASFYSTHLGGVQRLPNGNTLMVESTDGGHMWEVRGDGTVVWEFTPNAEVVRAHRYAPDFPGLGPL